MKIALPCLAIAMMSTTAGADPGREGPGACPSGAQLVEFARRAFSNADGLKNMKIQPNQLVCRVLRARVPTWLITFADTGCGDARVDAAMIVQNGALTWIEPGFYELGMRCRGGIWQPADLDGDGSDELLWVQDYDGHEGYRRRWLTVMAVSNGEPTESGQLALASRGANEGHDHYSYDCSASYRLVPALHGAQQIELVGHGYVRAPNDRCPKDGRHVYIWKGGKLIEP
jgi:hypothetical protein